MRRRAVAICAAGCAARMFALRMGGLGYWLSAPMDLTIVPRSYSWDVAQEVSFRSSK